MLLAALHVRGPVLDRRPTGLFNVAIAAGVLRASLGCVSFEALPEDENQPPFAALRAPVIAPVGVPVRLDASASGDPDGDPIDYRFEIAGFVGTETALPSVQTADPVALITFPGEGLYTAQVAVFDLHGDVGLALQDITVRSEYPDPPDFCATVADCAVGDECEAGVCFVNGGAVE